ncbi:MAG: trigger factor [Tannerella sp.]|jgi:trigger factor|nr:trigger factor [Tannerella sp.]
MNISLTKNDTVSGIIKVSIEESDYEASVAKNLQQLRSKVNMPGFRKGMVPIGLVRKMYGKHALVEEVNKCLSDNLFKYIREQDLKILGSPVASQNQQQIDFDTDRTFDFEFDIALSPEIKFDITKTDSLPYYTVEVEEQTVEKETESLRSSYGSYEKGETVEVSDMLKGVLTELEDGTPKVSGIFIEDAVLMPKYLKVKTEQKKFVGAKAGDKITFNPNKAYKGEEAELASLLKIDRSAVKDIKSDFTFEISEITRYKKAELGQELYDKIYGPDVVKSDEEFRDKLKQDLERQLSIDCDYHFRNEVQEMLFAKVGEIVFADDILKRWLLDSKEGNTPESVEKDFHAVKKELQKRLVLDTFIAQHNIKVEDTDIKKAAIQSVRIQFVHYGMLNIPDNILEKYAEDMLSRKDTNIDDMIHIAMLGKIAEVVKEMITVEEKTVGFEEYKARHEQKEDASTETETN